MRVLVDTNTLLSALLYPNSTTAKAFQLVLLNHQLILCDYVIEEAKTVVKRKFPNHLVDLNSFLRELNFETVFAPPLTPETMERMRDPKDVPILLTAEREKVDIILTGDKDFHALNIEKPRVLSAGQFLALIGELN